MQNNFEHFLRSLFLFFFSNTSLKVKYSQQAVRKKYKNKEIKKMSKKKKVYHVKAFWVSRIVDDMHFILSSYPL